MSTDLHVYMETENILRLLVRVNARGKFVRAAFLFKAAMYFDRQSGSSLMQACSICAQARCVQLCTP